MSFVGGNVPFSWEHLPGVSKFNTDKYPSNSNMGLHNLLVDHESSCLFGEKKIIPPPPPLYIQEPPHRSFSKRFSWKMEEEDPFLEALKECTKSDDGNNKMKRTFGSTSLGRLFPKLKKSKSKSVLSCMGSFHDVDVDVEVEVEEKNLVMPSSNPNPRQRFQGLIKLQERLRNWK